MFLFCGSSSIWQFQLSNGTRTGRFVFPAASILGLVNNNSVIQHGRTVKHLALLPGDNTFVLLFGNIDLDFIYYRQCCLRGVIEESVHFRRCVAAYRTFLQGLLQTAREGGRTCNVCVLAPQPSPLRDDVFAAVTSKHANVSEEAIRKLGERMDVSHICRLKRTGMFADVLERDLAFDESIKVFRIDGEMIGPDGNLVSRFYPKMRREHHANPVETLKSWQRALSEELDMFRVFRPAKTGEDPLVPAIA